MRLLRGRSDKGRERSDRGAVLVEFALVIPVLTLLVLGIFEYGNAYHKIGGLERAAQQGARAVSFGANSRYADFEALKAIDTATRGLSGITVESVVIFKVQDEDGEVPAGCLTGPQSGVCNFYTGAQLRAAGPHGFPGGPGASSCGGGWDASWCPTSRPRQQENLVQIGVHLTVTYDSVTNLLPTTIRMSRTAIYQIDPCQQGQETC